MAQQTVGIEWNGNDVYMTFTADMEWDDYGVPGSPRWLTPTNIKWEDYEYNGEMFTNAQLIAKLSKESVAEIDDLLIAASEEKEWDTDDEPDYEPDYD